MMLCKFGCVAGYDCMVVVEALLHVDLCCTCFAVTALALRHTDGIAEHICIICRRMVIRLETTQFPGRRFVFNDYARSFVL